MHTALFVASVTSKSLDWTAFLEAVNGKLKQAKGVLRLAENVWMLNLQESVESLGVLIYFAETKGIAYGVLAFERAPQWLPGSFDPSTLHIRTPASYLE